MEAALEDAVTWRDSFFKEEPIARRFVEGAGVYTSRDKHTEYYNAVWQYEKKQVRRSFSTKVYGYLAEEVAHMARELGVLTELDRLEDHFERV